MVKKSEGMFNLFKFFQKILFLQYNIGNNKKKKTYQIVSKTTGSIFVCFCVVSVVSKFKCRKFACRFYKYVHAHG